MLATMAKNYYLGLHNHKRMNCAQSVIAAFSKEYDLKYEDTEAFLHFGNGRAPEGLCGAAYAVKYLLEQFHAGKEAEFQQYFIALAGSNKCREIRQMKRLSCLDCVNRSAEYLSTVCTR